MRKNPRRILRPQRLPFRHPGSGTTNLTYVVNSCNSGRVLRSMQNKIRILRMLGYVLLHGGADNIDLEVVVSGKTESRF